MNEPLNELGPGWAVMIPGIAAGLGATAAEGGRLAWDLWKQRKARLAKEKRNKEASKYPKVLPIPEVLPVKRGSFAEYVARQAEDYELLKEDIAGFSSEQIDMALDGLTTALDVWGLEQVTGWIGDLLSAGLSAGRGAVKLYQGDKSRAAGHGIDAAASLVSAIPLGDVAKLIKLRKGSNYARLFIKAAKPARAAAKTHKAGRQVQRAGNVGNQIAGKIGGEIGPIIQGQRPGSVAAMAGG